MFRKTMSAESFKPILDEEEKEAAKKTAAAMKAPAPQKQ